MRLRRQLHQPDRDAQRVPTARTPKKRSTAAVWHRSRATASEMCLPRQAAICKALDVRGLIWRVRQDGSVNGHRCQSGGSSVAGAGGWSRPTAWTRARSPWKSGLRRSARHDRCATNDAHPGPSLLRTSTVTPSPPGLSTVSSPQHPHGQLNSRRSEARIVRRTQRGGWYLLISWTTASTCSPIGGYSSGSARDVPDGLSMKPASTDEPTVSCPRTAVITPQRSWLTMVARTAAPTTRSPPRLSKRCIG